MEKMSAKKSIDIFKVFSVFLFCSFIGWICETAGTAIIKQAFTERGYLFILEPLPRYFPFLQNITVLKNVPLIVGLPLIEVYGFGGMIAIFGLRRLSSRPVLLFLTGMVVLTLFELIGSYFCSYVLHRTFWDYSGHFLNFQGRICLMSAVAWGTGSVLAVKAAAPFIDKQYAKLQDSLWFKIIVSLLIAGALVCALSKYWWFADTLSK